MFSQTGNRTEITNNIVQLITAFYCFSKLNRILKEVNGSVYNEMSLFIHGVYNVIEDIERLTWKNLLIL